MDPFVFPGMGFDFTSEEISEVKSKIKQLNPVRYQYNCGRVQELDGFIADEVQQIIPEAVVGEKDAIDENGDPVYQKILLGQLVPLLTAGIQEAIRDIEALEKRIAEIEDDQK